MVLAPTKNNMPIRIEINVLRRSADGVQLEIIKRWSFLFRMFEQIRRKPSTKFNTWRMMGYAVGYIRQIKKLEAINRELNILILQHG